MTLLDVGRSSAVDQIVAMSFPLTFNDVSISSRQSTSFLEKWKGCVVVNLHGIHLYLFS